jgi:hypothetical protein
MIALATSLDPWTGTPARAALVVRSPEEDESYAIKVALAAVQHVIKTRGPNRARLMTLEQMEETLVDDPL